MNDPKRDDVAGLSGSGVERVVRAPEPERAKQACKHPNKVTQNFTYGMRWHCPDCKASREDWWD